MRADAQRNLDRLLEAASACFAERGLEASVDEIAERAGVGHGTVFRRFPTKEALLVAVLCERLRELTEAADEALAHEDSAAAFTRFFRHAAELYASNRALVEGFAHCIATEEKSALHDALARLVRRAQASGRLRKDVTADDVLELIPAASGHFDVVLDGLLRR